MMGVLGAFIFTAQMINFTIPGTGSSGHLGGGLALAVLLGPHAAFLTIASVLTVQALFFADGGLLALGCNIFNLGFFPAFLAYPLLYRPLAGDGRSPARAWAAALVAAVVGLQLGAFCVVLETRASGLTELPFGPFLLLMQPIHLAIGVVEGLATAVLGGLLVAAALIGGLLSWFASDHPDGLEWAVANVTGQEEIQGAESGLHGTLAGVQEKTALLPDYQFDEKGNEAGGAARVGASVSGLVGGALTLLLAGAVGFALRLRGRDP
jgi:cobalt/nickel transport system permease protein